MNKRQTKKKRKKVVPPFIDELVLLTLNAEESKRAKTDCLNYIQKNYSYYHYKDKEKLLKNPCEFVYPVSKSSCLAYLHEMMKRVRRFPANPAPEQ